MFMVALTVGKMAECMSAQVQTVEMANGGLGPSSTVEKVGWLIMNGLQRRKSFLALHFILPSFLELAQRRWHSHTCPL